MYSFTFLKDRCQFEFFYGDISEKSRKLEEKIRYRYKNWMLFMVLFFHIKLKLFFNFFQLFFFTMVLFSQSVF